MKVASSTEYLMQTTIYILHEYRGGIKFSYTALVVKIFSFHTDGLGVVIRLDGGKYLTRKTGRRSTSKG